MKDLLILFGILAVWFGLTRWILPWFGIPTCMSGSCRTNQNATWNDDASPRCGLSPQHGECEPEKRSD